MKSRRLVEIVCIIAFMVCLLIPLFAFNFEENVESEIDNRMLAENPFTSGNEYEDLTVAIENYVNDRIGFRNEMIRTYTVMHDKIWGEMIHPIYDYGKDGEVFGGFEQIVYSSYHDTYLDMIEQIQWYCEERGVPFLFVFEPSKSSAMAEKAPEGMNYDISWRAQFVQGLEDRNINYIDNYDILQGGYVDGERVFNVKFDAKHWNSLGAYYGVNNMLRKMQETYPEVHINDLAEFEKSTNTETTLLVSEFPINEVVDYYSIGRDGIEALASEYADEVYRDPSFQAFGYFVNGNREDASPKTLVFQGSYMNGQGKDYLINALREYILVHDYQNVMNFEYYYNIFQPEYVIFESADYTLNETYFSSEKMETMDLHPSLLKELEGKEVMQESEAILCNAELGNKLATITLGTENLEADYIWLFNGNTEYAVLSGETVGASMDKEEFLEMKDVFQVYVMRDGMLHAYDVEWK